MATEDATEVVAVSGRKREAALVIESVIAAADDRNLSGVLRIEEATETEEAKLLRPRSTLESAETT